MKAKKKDPPGFRCPLCGASTRVEETRSIVGGVRRRRQCLACKAKVTTAELAVAQDWARGRHARTRGPVVAIRRADLQRIAALATSGLGDPPLEEGAEPELDEAKT